MDTRNISNQAHAPTYERTPEQRKRTGIMPLVIGANWMVEHNGRPAQFEALPRDLVLAEARREGRELKMVWRDLSTGRDWASPEAHRAAYPDDAGMARAGEIHCCAWWCEELADPQAKQKAEIIERDNKARRKLIDAARASIEKAASIDEADAIAAKIAAQEKLIAGADEKRQALLSNIIGLCSSTWHPSHELAPGKLPPGQQYTSTPIFPA